MQDVLTTPEKIMSRCGNAKGDLKVWNMAFRLSVPKEKNHRQVVHEID